MLNANTAFRTAAINGFLAVALGAFGAHGLHDLLVRNAAVEIWRTASMYHLIHAVVMLFVAGRSPFSRPAWWLFLSGVTVFSGSLYLLAVTGGHWLGAMTPVGGVGLLAGWLALVFSR